MSKGAGEKERKLKPSELVDSALAGVLKMRMDISAANGEGGTLERFKKNYKIVDYYEGGFSVEMGFGLHIGWAIEGAIGSNYKIDASYLSPNVNMAARLEAATHQFGTPLLLSGPFVNELTREARDMCRKIDVVTVKGSQIPLELWTCDITDVNLDSSSAITPVMRDGTQQPLDMKKVKAAVQKSENLEFSKVFERGVEMYIGGDWAGSKVNIEKALALREGRDGPCESLLGVLGDGVTPEGWRGFRELTSK